MLQMCMDFYWVFFVFKAEVNRSHSSSNMGCGTTFPNCMFLFCGLLRCPSSLPLFLALCRVLFKGAKLRDLPSYKKRKLGVFVSLLAKAMVATVAACK
mmetsp:Transcript_18380/g.25289  ORF Transcript_18380/g.25289 Transcript_18380/m.25289 type:complete len:98 (+) Transcript_18380:141-434(+)